MKTDAKSGILYECWQAREPKAVFILIHGLGGHTGRWEALADFFRKKNISLYAIELRGFGSTDGEKGHVKSFGVYFRDIASLYGIAKKEHPEAKIFLLGESMGGLIAFLCAADNRFRWDGLIAISPAFGNKLKMPLLHYLSIPFFFIFRPTKKFRLSFTHEMCTQDAAYIKIMKEDLREHRLASSGLLTAIVFSQIKSLMLRKCINIPVLFMLASPDSMVDAERSRFIFKKLVSRDKTLLEYPGMCHALSIDIGKEKVFNDIWEWVKNRF